MREILQIVTQGGRVAGFLQSMREFLQLLIEQRVESGQRFGDQ